MEEDYQIRVIIAGGGVAGLVLANALEKAGIDFVLLERRSKISPQIGQSIAAEPNGSRILDQLGILDEWKKHSQACTWWYERDKNGEVLLKTDGIRLSAARNGYDVLFGERSKYLEVFYDSIKSKGKILLNKNIISVEHSDSGVNVKCEDSTSYQGDILAGADGVRSKVREEMWRMAGSRFPELVEHDKHALFAEYRALFGISEAPPGLIPGDCDFGYDQDRSTLVFAGPLNKAYVFIFEKMDKIYKGSEIPRFTKDDTMKFIKKHSSIRIRPDLTIADFWEKIDNHSFVCLEEGVFKLWTCGRIACVGDSAHKMTPNIGAGGNAGIESAAALANAVMWVKGNSEGRRPSSAMIEEALKMYQKQRETRAGIIVRSAGEVTRMQAGRSLYHRAIAKIVRLYPGDFIADYLSGYFSGAVMLSYLPPPKASIRGHQPFNPTQGWSRHESKIRRALLAFPFIVTFYLAYKAMDVTALIPILAPMISKGGLAWDTDVASIRKTFYNIKRLDDIWVPINIFFTPAIYGYDSLCRTQAMMLLTDYGVILAIWAFESVRRANILTFAQLPMLFTFLGQLLGIGVISPIYYFLHYTFTPLEKLKALDMRLGRMNYALTFLPTLILTYYIPGFAMFFWPTLSGRESWLFLWQMFPVWIFLGTRLFESFVKDTTVTDRFEAPNRDMPVIRYTIGILSAISAIVWLLTCKRTLSQFGLVGLDNLFIPLNLPSQTTNLAAFTREFLKFDAIFLFCNTFLWLGLLFRDMKHAGMLRIGWMRLLASFIGTILVFGPGATVGIAWLWREGVLAGKRHRSAVTEETLGDFKASESKGAKVL